MIDGLGSSYHQFLLNLGNSNRRLQQVQQQLTSGLRVQQASDDPSAVVDIVETRSQSERAAQAKTNLGQVQTEVDTAENVVSSSIKLVEQAATLAAQGATGTADGNQRQLVAQQIDSITSRLVEGANTQVQGRYIFSGDSDTTAPYSYSAGSSTPVSSYAGSASTRQVLDASGTALTVSRTAQQVFDSSVPSENVFTALTNLRNGLLANDPTAISSAQDNLHTALAHLNQEDARYGAFQNSVKNATTAADQQSTQLQANLSGLQDTDLAAAATEMSQLTLGQQAALAARSKMPQNSLFSFLA